MKTQKNSIRRNQMSNKSKRNSNVSQSPDLESIISWLDSKSKLIGATYITIN
jgi:hypothetical protein